MVAAMHDFDQALAAANDLAHHIAFPYTPTTAVVRRLVAFMCTPAFEVLTEDAQKRIRSVLISTARVLLNVRAPPKQSGMKPSHKRSGDDSGVSAAPGMWKKACDWVQSAVTPLSEFAQRTFGMYSHEHQAAMCEWLAAYATVIYDRLQVLDINPSAEGSQAIYLMTQFFIRGVWFNAAVVGCAVGTATGIPTPELLANVHIQQCLTEAVQALRAAFVYIRDHIPDIELQADNAPGLVHNLPHFGISNGTSTMRPLEMSISVLDAMSTKEYAVKPILQFAHAMCKHYVKYGRSIGRGALFANAKLQFAPAKPQISRTYPQHWRGPEVVHAYAAEAEAAHDALVRSRDSTLRWVIDITMKYDLDAWCKVYRDLTAFFALCASSYGPETALELEAYDSSIYVSIVSACRFAPNPQAILTNLVKYDFVILGMFMRGARRYCSKSDAELLKGVVNEYDALVNAYFGAVHKCSLVHVCNQYYNEDAQAWQLYAEELEAAQKQAEQDAAEEMARAERHIAKELAREERVIKQYEAVETVAAMQRRLNEEDAWQQCDALWRKEEIIEEELLEQHAAHEEAEEAEHLELQIFVRDQTAAAQQAEWEAADNYWRTDYDADLEYEELRPVLEQLEQTEAQHQLYEDEANAPYIQQQEERQWHAAEAAARALDEEAEDASTRLWLEDAAGKAAAEAATHHREQQDTEVDNVLRQEAERARLEAEWIKTEHEEQVLWQRHLHQQERSMASTTLRLMDNCHRCVSRATVRGIVVTAGQLAMKNAALYVGSGLGAVDTYARRAGPALAAATERMRTYCLSGASHTLRGDLGAIIASPVGSIGVVLAVGVVAQVCSGWYDLHHQGEGQNAAAVGKMLLSVAKDLGVKIGVSAVSGALIATMGASFTVTITVTTVGFLAFRQIQAYCYPTAVAPIASPPRPQLAPAVHVVERPKPKMAPMPVAKLAKPAIPVAIKVAPTIAPKP
jgi:hypothetical protein